MLAQRLIGPMIVNSEANHGLAVNDQLNYQDALKLIKDGEPVDLCVQRLLSQLTKAERLSLLDGDEPFYKGLRSILNDRYNATPYIFGAVKRLGIPGIRFADGPRGSVLGRSTAFPIPMARGATWDVALEQKVGEAIGLEARAQGANFFGGVCVNLPRHPAWGRIQETYGEDPILLGEFGLALTTGIQQNLMACVKHFALNSMENARFRVNVNVQDDVLREVYLAHFRLIVEGGAASVMTAYNSVNGAFAGENRQLLTGILRNEWGFDGFTISDFIFGLRDSVSSVKNGLDIEAPFAQQRHLTLQRALDTGELEWSQIDQACSRILFKQLQFDARITSTCPVPPPSVVFCSEHRMLARRVASRSQVLLKNDKSPSTNAALLPLRLSPSSRIAVIGRLADTPNTGDHGSSRVFSPSVTTPYEGLKQALPNHEVLLGESPSLEHTIKLALEVDVVICVVGYDATTEGEFVCPSLEKDPALIRVLPPQLTDEDRETVDILSGRKAMSAGSAGLEAGSGGDRKSLRLKASDVQMILAIAKVNTRLVVSIVSGGAVIMEEWIHHVPAVLMSWYSGSEGGHGLADVLLGHEDASGRLPFSIPTDESHLPEYSMEATRITYDRWFGQALLDKLGVSPAFPIGFGLSYTRFKLTKLRLHQELGCEESLMVQVDAQNTGSRAGTHVIQVYARSIAPDRPERLLLGFGSVRLQAAEITVATVQASLRPLQRWIQGKYVLLEKWVIVEVGAFSGDRDALSMQYEVPEKAT